MTARLPVNGQLLCVFLFLPEGVLLCIDRSANGRYPPLRIPHNACVHSCPPPSSTHRIKLVPSTLVFLKNHHVPLNISDNDSGFPSPISTSLCHILWNRIYNLIAGRRLHACCSCDRESNACLNIVSVREQSYIWSCTNVCTARGWGQEVHRLPLPRRAHALFLPSPFLFLLLPPASTLCAKRYWKIRIYFGGEERGGGRKVVEDEVVPFKTLME